MIGASPDLHNYYDSDNPLSNTESPPTESYKTMKWEGVIVQLSKLGVSDFELILLTQFLQDCQNHNLIEQSG